MKKKLTAALVGLFVVGQASAWTYTLENRSNMPIRATFTFGVGKDEFRIIEPGRRGTVHSGAKCNTGVKIENVYRTAGKATQYEEAAYDWWGSECWSTDSFVWDGGTISW